MEKIPVNLEGVRFTALIEQYARWQDARDKHPILGDPWAERVTERLDFDHGEFKGMSAARFAVGVRSRQMDDWVRTFIERRPDAVIMDLGCGFDSRVFRIDPPAGHLWYDVDLPEVIEIRDRLYPERPERTSIAADVTEPSWLEPIPGDRPVIVIADGLFGFLSEEQVRLTFTQIVDHFPEGEFVFNTYSALIRKRSIKKPTPLFKRHGLTIDWTIEEARDVEKLDGRLRFLEEKSQVDTPLLARTPLSYRLTCALIRAVPSWRNSGRVLRYGFG